MTITNHQAETPNPLTRLLRGSFHLYHRWLSPMLHAVSGSCGACRFQPTCSEYAELAIETHGVFRGSALALRRVAKCHPLHAAACDPVPPRQAAIAPFRHTSPPPVTIEETGFPAIASAPSRPATKAMTATSPQVRR